MSKGLAGGTRKVLPIPTFNFSDWEFSYNEALEKAMEAVRENLEQEIANPVARTLIEELQREISTVLVDFVEGDPMIRVNVAWGENGDVIDIMSLDLLEELRDCIDIDWRDHCPELPTKLREIADKMDAMPVWP